LALLIGTREKQAKPGRKREPDLFTASAYWRLRSSFFSFFAAFFSFGVFVAAFFVSFLVSLDLLMAMLLIGVASRKSQLITASIGDVSVFIAPLALPNTAKA
jgi:hypothetical protein